jgi:4-amino-4-deoxy-L-arabinose transferase-like glycosyltransferase
LFFSRCYFSISALQSTTRIILLFLGCALFHAAGTWNVALIDRDEPRFSEASREMMERGDYVIPYFNGQYRFDKPPFTYWAQVASYRIFGQNEFSARLPSAIAAALTAVLLFLWGARLGRERIGWWAAIIFSTSLQVVIHAKAAVADMWLVLFVTLAHWAGYELLRDRLSDPEKPSTSNQQPATIRVWWITFYFALALAFLAKGPIGWTPLLTVAAIIVFLRDRTLLKRFTFGRGMALTFLLVCLWGVPALIQTQGEFFAIGIGRHVVGRSMTAMGGHGARSVGVYLLLIPFYLVTVFLSFLPWSLKLPWLVGRLRRNRDATDIYLLCGASIVFVIFSFVTTKLLHYTLPAFPLLALLLARRWFAEERSTLFLKRAATIAVCVYLVLVLFIAPFTKPFFPSRELFLKAHDYLRPEMQFGAVGYNEPSLVWYFRNRVRGFLQTSKLHPEAVQPYMEQSGPRFIILTTDLAEKTYPALPEGWMKFSTRGFNAVKGRRSELTLILKPE